MYGLESKYRFGSVSRVLNYKQLFKSSLNHRNRKQTRDLEKLHAPHGASAAMSRISRAPEEKQVSSSAILWLSDVSCLLEASKNRRRIPLLGRHHARTSARRLRLRRDQSVRPAIGRRVRPVRDIKGGREQEERGGRVRRLKDSSTSRQTTEEGVAKRQEKHSPGKEGRHAGSRTSEERGYEGFQH